MKTKLNRLPALMFCAGSLGVGLSFSLVGATKSSADIPSAKSPQTGAWSEIGGKAGAVYQRDGLALIATNDCAAISKSSKAKPRAKDCG